MDKLPDFKKLETIGDQWGYLRQMYLELNDTIIETAQKNKHAYAIAYPIDWSRIFSPIERIAWGDIRTIGRVVLYPQYPLFNYFIDFANPYLKIGLELDGKQHNEEKDRLRDERLATYGWKIFRITGAECYAQGETEVLSTLIDLLETETWEEEGWESEENLLIAIHYGINYTCEGVIYAIKLWYFGGHYRHPKLKEYAYQSLKDHCYTDIPENSLQGVSVGKSYGRNIFTFPFKKSEM